MAQYLGGELNQPTVAGQFSNFRVPQSVSYASPTARRISPLNLPEHSLDFPMVKNIRDNRKALLSNRSRMLQACSLANILRLVRRLCCRASLAGGAAVSTWLLLTGQPLRHGNSRV